MADLTSLKADIDDLNVDKLKSLPVDLFKLSNWVENEAVKKMCIMNWLKSSCIQIIDASDSVIKVD